MGKIVFNPGKSFFAKLYWHQEAITSEDWDPKRVMRIGANGLVNELWNGGGWLAAGSNASNNPDLETSESVHALPAQFWLGCYTKDGEYLYEIRNAGLDAYRFDWKFNKHRLDISRNGYLALYQAGERPGHDVLGSGSMYWRLPGFEPDALLQGAPVSGLELISKDGKRIKRLIESDFPYLSSSSGTPGWLAMKLIRQGVQS